MKVWDKELTWSFEIVSLGANLILIEWVLRWQHVLWKYEKRISFSPHLIIWDFLLRSWPDLWDCELGGWHDPMRVWAQQLTCFFKIVSSGGDLILWAYELRNWPYPMRSEFRSWTKPMRMSVQQLTWSYKRVSLEAGKILSSDTFL